MATFFSEEERDHLQEPIPRECAVCAGLERAQRRRLQARYTRGGLGHDTRQQASSPGRGSADHQHGAAGRNILDILDRRVVLDGSTIFFGCNPCRMPHRSNPVDVQTEVTMNPCVKCGAKLTTKAFKWLPGEGIFCKDGCSPNKSLFAYEEAGPCTLG